MVIRSLVSAVAVLVGLSALPAAASQQAERLAYVMQFGGLTVADVMITLDETPVGYHTDVKLKSRGLLAMFRDFTAELSGEGKLMNASLGAAPDLAAAPTSYRRVWSIGDLSSDLTMRFDAASREAVAEERLFDPTTGEKRRREDAPWNRRRERAEPVPTSMRTGVLDPLAAFILAREMIRAGGPRAFRVPVFDGNRRYDVVGTTEAPQEVTINGETRRLIAVRGKVVPLSGFDENLGDRVHEGEGKILFTADDRFLPVQIMVGNSLGVGVMNLVADCRTKPAACEEFGQEQAQAPAN